MVIVALVAHSGARPDDAVRSIEAGEADVLLAAHPVVVGSPDVLAEISERVERLGGELHFVSKARVVTPERPLLTDLAVGMAHQGLQPEQIAAVLDVDEARVRGLLQRVGTWMQKRIGKK